MSSKRFILNTLPNMSWRRRWSFLYLQKLGLKHLLPLRVTLGHASQGFNNGEDGQTADQSKRLSSLSSSCWSFSNMLQASLELSETKTLAPQTGSKEWQGLGVMLLWQGLRFFTRLSKIYMLTWPGGVSSPMWRLSKQTSIKVLLAALPPTSTVLYTTVQ